MFSFFPMLTFTKPKYFKLVKSTKQWQPAHQLEKIPQIHGKHLSILPVFTYYLAGLMVSHSFITREHRF